MGTWCLVEIVISSLQGRASFTRFVSSIASRGSLIAWHRLHATFQDTAAHFWGLLPNYFRTKKHQGGRSEIRLLGLLPLPLHLPPSACFLHIFLLFISWLAQVFDYLRMPLRYLQCVSQPTSITLSILVYTPLPLPLASHTKTSCTIHSPTCSSRSFVFPLRARIMYYPTQTWAWPCMAFCRSHYRWSTITSRTERSLRSSTTRREAWSGSTAQTAKSSVIILHLGAMVVGLWYVRSIGCYVLRW
jgi:hypothetical protein